jgi:gliding motility-associated-like protein
VIRNITISNPKSAGTARGAEFCLGATDVVTLINRLDNADSPGAWTVVSGGSTGFDASTGTFNLTGRPAGTYVFRYTLTPDQAPCPNDSEDITIRINPLPVADAGTDKNIDCTVQSAVLGTDLTSSGTNIVYEWKLLNAIVGTSKNYTALAGGTYVLTVRDTVTNCSSTDNVVVIQADDLPIFDISVDTIACFGEVAQITLSNIRGGQSPYEISFNGGQTYGSALVASNLGAGTYKVQVRDANGCVNDQLPAIVITSPPLFAVNLGQDFFLNITEDSLLSIIGQYDPNTFQSITWAANDVEIVSARDQGSYNAKPEVDTRYRVTVINESGCIATDEVRISIRRVKPECVPNIFSPNESEVNEYFSINCAEVELVTKYSIYDRWGNLLFVGENLSPDNPSSFWDGKFKGQDVVPGVYAYYLEMLFKDGSTEKRGGDVTVIR